MKPTRQENGFTLLEVMIAMIILLLGILSLYPAQISSIRGNARANNQTTASIFARNQIEQILSWKSSDPRLADSENVIIPGSANMADGSAVFDKYTIYWDGTPRMDPVNTSQQVGIDLDIQAVWNEDNLTKTLTMYITKPI